MTTVHLCNIWGPTAIAKTVGPKTVPNITLDIKNDTHLADSCLRFSKPNRDYNYTFVKIGFSVFQATLIRFTPCPFCFLLSYSRDGK